MGMERIKRLYSKPAIVGWVSVILLIWKVIETLDTLKGVVENINTAWNFLSTPIGMLLLLVIGLGLLFYAIFRPGKTSGQKKIVINKDDHIVPIVMSRGLLRTDDYTSANLGRWLLEQLTREKSMPLNFFQVQPDWFGLYLDSISGPYILFRFSIRTSAMHTFEFLPQNTTGHINFMNQDLARVPEVEDQTHNKLTRETQTMLAVKQYLEPVTASYLRELHDKNSQGKFAFEFNKLSVYIKAYRPDGSVDNELWKLPLRSFGVFIANEPIRS